VLFEKIQENIINGKKQNPRMQINNESKHFCQNCKKRIQNVNFLLPLEIEKYQRNEENREIYQNIRDKKANVKEKGTLR